jgi:hypothetical protein
MNKSLSYATTDQRRMRRWGLRWFGLLWVAFAILLGAMFLNAMRLGQVDYQLTEDGIVSVSRSDTIISIRRWSMDPGRAWTYSGWGLSITKFWFCPTPHPTATIDYRFRIAHWFSATGMLAWLTAIFALYWRRSVRRQ